MAMTEDQNATAQSEESHVAYEFACQYPSKKCGRVRATKRGGDLHRLCAFHRERANKNQWLVDQRRRLRREHQHQHQQELHGSATPAAYLVTVEPAAFDKSPLQPALLMALDNALETNSPMESPMHDVDLYFLEALFFDEEGEILLSDSASDGYLTDAAAEWIPSK